MAICSVCGKEFDLDEAKERFDDYFSDEGLTYDADVDGVECADCAIADTNSGIGGWNAMPDEYKNTYDD